MSDFILWCSFLCSGLWSWPASLCLPSVLRLGCRWIRWTFCILGCIELVGPRWLGHILPIWPGPVPASFVLTASTATRTTRTLAQRLQSPLGLGASMIGLWLPPLLLPRPAPRATAQGATLRKRTRSPGVCFMSTKVASPSTVKPGSGCGLMWPKSILKAKTW